MLKAWEGLREENYTTTRDDFPVVLVSGGSVVVTDGGILVVVTGGVLVLVSGGLDVDCGRVVEGG